jgi:hypothetical protein
VGLTWYDYPACRALAEELGPDATREQFVDAAMRRNDWTGFSRRSRAMDVVQEALRNEYARVWLWFHSPAARE